MRKYSKFIIGFFIILVLNLTACNDELATSTNNKYEGETLTVTLTVNRPGADTHTTLTESSDKYSLESRWSENDELLLVEADGTTLGKLSLIKGIGETSGIFSGEISGVEVGKKYRLWYLGSKYSVETSDEVKPAYSTISDGKLSIQLGDRIENSTDYKNIVISGDLSQLSRADLMTDEVEIIMVGDKAQNSGIVNLKSQLAMARFHLINLPEDIENDANAVFALSSINSENVKNLPYGKINIPAYSALSVDEGTLLSLNHNKYGYIISNDVFKNVRNEEIVDATTNVKKTVSCLDVYLPLIPGTYSLSFDIITGEGIRYYYSFGTNNTVNGGMYYSYASINGQETPDISPGIIAPLEEEDVVGPLININGKKFRFTRANLHYQRKTSTTSEKWYLPAYQTQYVNMSGRAYLSGAATNNPTIIDLFRWGATGIENATYQPRPADFWKEYAYNTNSRNIIDNMFPSANTSQNNTLNTNSTLCPGQSMQDKPWDWGQAYGKGRKGHYYTLTNTEMKAVIDSYCVVLGRVVDVFGKEIYGAILFPYSTIGEVKAELAKLNLPESIYDSDTLFKLDASTEPSKAEYAWDRLKLTYEQLTNLNCVFFPAAGMNNPGMSYDYSNTGYYWTSTVSTTPNAIAWCFDGQTTQSSRLFKVYGRGKGQAFSVRLVKEYLEPNDNESVGETVEGM